MKRTKYYCSLSIVFFILLISNVQLAAQLGVFSVGGNLTTGPSSNTEIQLSSTSGAGTGHDQIFVTGDLTIDGTLTIVLNGYTPNDVDQFEIMDFNGTLSGTFSSIIWPPSMSAWGIDYGVDNPNKVTIYGPLNALPVDLVNFEAEYTKAGNVLKWQTASEINNDYFQVEYSRDAKSFSSLDQIEGKGNTSELSSYEYIHSTQERGIHYYRLKQVDMDGAYDYSNIVRVEQKANDVDLSLFPNPSSGIVNFNREVTDLKVFNLDGRMVMKVDNPGLRVDLTSLSPGQYYILMDGESERSLLTIIQ